uniref:Uncharacterized protein n=1 Tax=Arundo donax TaxID=35708 RepID=A0A0A9EJ70_ARUDO
MIDSLNLVRDTKNSRLHRAQLKSRHLLALSGTPRATFNPTIAAAYFHSLCLQTLPAITRITATRTTCWSRFT